MQKKVKPNSSPQLAAQLKKDLKSLQGLRKKIDSADRKLFAALSQRMKAVEQVGKIKKTHDMPLYQKARWQEVVDNRLGQAKDLNIDAKFTLAFLNLIHKESIRIQKKENKK